MLVSQRVSVILNPIYKNEKRGQTQENGFYPVCEKRPFIDLYRKESLNGLLI